ncbi:MAG TPA: hypothetical protein VEP46_15375 [Vicinamibacterales bacterium]|nr:hypothetical protein [Vicinamibacterales bacterium]
MKTRAYSVVAAVALVIVAGVTLRAQEQSAQASASAQGAATAEQTRERRLASIVPLKVTIVLSKYQGEKKIASEPYELSLRTDGNNASIRMATQMSAEPPPPAPPGAARPAPRPNPFTNIDCSATSLDSGRYALTVTIEDSSIYEDNQRNADGSKTERTRSVRMFRTTNALVLRDGQSTEFTAATDKSSGEGIKAAVTLTVVK